MPHWEVDGHWHFVTVRCEGSLPAPVRRKIDEIRAKLEDTEPGSEAFLRLQRRYFAASEKYLDSGEGFAPFVRDDSCGDCLRALDALESEGWQVGEFVLMPNDAHMLVVSTGNGLSMREALMRFKGRSSRAVNRRIGRRGRLWQQDWFDRWMRDEPELTRTVRYIRENPVKAGLAPDWQSYRWRVNRLTCH